MKYLFYVQSHIAFYLALQVKEYLKVNNKDAKFICVRNYKNKYHSINFLDFSKYYDALSSPMSLKEAIMALEEIDLKVNDLCENDNYEFITHSIAPPVWQFIATNPKCKKIHLIEDGSSSYHKRSDFYIQKNLPFKKKVINFFKKLVSNQYRIYSQRAPGFPIFSTQPLFNDTVYYGIYEEVFPFVPPSQKVIFKQIYKDPLFPYQPTLDHIKLIIFDATIVEQRSLMNEEEYLNFIFPLLASINSQDKKIFYKFHPGQFKHMTKQIKDFLDKELHAQELDKDIPVEQIIIHNHNLEFYGFYSTLLFYAKRHGHFVKSFIEGTKHPKLRQFALDNFNDYFIKEIFKLT